MVSCSEPQRKPWSQSSLIPSTWARKIGFFAVLHTWGQTLLHHPHLHCVVTGGGFSADGTEWISCPDGFFLSVRVLSRLFRRLFLEKLVKPLMPATWSFSPPWNHSGTGPHFWITWLPCARPNG